MNNASVVLQCEGLKKAYEGLSVNVLNGIDLSIHAGDQVAIVGASGSGKSTLLHLMGGLDTPSQGQVTLMGQNLTKLNAAEQARLRNEHLGFVYQFHHLLPEFTALENVAMPLLIRRMAREEALKMAEAQLGKVGLEHRLHHMPSELSGGERQRAAVARALVTAPKCILADEPTGNLDRGSAGSLFALLKELNLSSQLSLVVVTHDLALADQMQSCYRLIDGRLQAVD